MAPPTETHYDRLKVMRDAPLEVIKASYRALSQKYHPDRNPAPDAARVMALINQAWDVLSDPEKRATHDRWIAHQEQQAVHRPKSPAARPVPRPQQKTSVKSHEKRSWVGRYKLHLSAALVLTLGAVIMAGQLNKPSAVVEDGMVRVEQVPAKSRSDGAGMFGDDGDAKPVAMPWETVPAQRLPHGYLAAERQFFSAGLSSFEIDNTAGDKDADVRLYRNGRSVRSMFVHQGQRFVAGKLDPGTYVMKYRVAVAGKMHAYQIKPVFQLNQAVEEDDKGKRFDKFTRLRVAMSEVASDTLPVEEIPLDQM